MTKEELNLKLTAEVVGMKQYLLLKYSQGDWHGVMDAAADLRELEAELKGLNFQEPEGQ